MTDMALLAITLLFMSVGLLSPFVWSLGYVWVDTFLPHMLSYGLLSGIPIAFIMGGGSMALYAILDRRNPPKLTVVHVLIAVLAVWITLTTTWAVMPAQAWFKWDTSFKTLVFTCFIPFVFRTRVQIEAFLLVLTMSAAAHLLPWGVKTFATGGGYQMSLGLLGSNSTFIAESSAAAAMFAMFVPLLLWLRTYSIIVPGQQLRSVASFGMIILYLVGNIGTFARTGLLGLGVLGIGLLMRTKRRILFIMAALMVVGVLSLVATDKWSARVSTITTYEQDNSAYGRILIWEWTVKYALQNPFGGGFNSFLINRIVYPDGSEDRGRAFHNIYFANLGEHGFPGLALYLTIMALSLRSMQRVVRQCRGRPDLLWASELARSAQLALVILLLCANFVDISYYFIIWDIVALMLCLRAHVQRALTPQAAKRSLLPELPSAIASIRPSMPQAR